MKMLILAGGLGTRLRQAVSDVPKPLAPVDNLPFLYFQLENWISQGTRSFVFLLHYQADMIKSFIESHRHTLLSDCDISVLVEPERLDTGGAVAYAVRTLNLTEDFIVTNADTWLGNGIAQLINIGANSLVIIKQADVSRFGQVEIDGQSLVTAFREKGMYKGEGWINAGMCILNPSLFRHWDGQKISLEKDIFPLLLKKRELQAVAVTSDFIDIGIPDDYRRFCVWQVNGRKDKLCN
jgi:D-glycero-alpha-D-manno-heptose 1-phosphate guanylyltransferase